MTSNSEWLCYKRQCQHLNDDGEKFVETGDDKFFPDYLNFELCEPNETLPFHWAHAAKTTKTSSML